MFLNGRYDFGSIIRGNGDKVWYWYYDTNDSDRDTCLQKNKDIIKLPSDVETEELTWDSINKIRKLG